MQTYVISYDDIEALNKKIEEIKDALNMTFDESKYDLMDDNIYSVIDEVNTISLFSDPKFVVVKSAEKLDSITEKQLKELLMTINDIESNNVLIFCVDLNSDSKSKENINRVKKFALSIEIRFKNISLEDYAREKTLSDGYKITEDAINMVSNYSTNLLQLRSNLEILECFTSGINKIEEKDVELLIKKPLEDNVFTLVNAVLKNDKVLAYNVYKDLMVSNIVVTYLISLLLTRFQELYNCYYLVKSKLDQQSIANILNISTNKAYYVMNDIKNANINDIKEHIKRLSDLEYKIKSGKINQDLGFELYLLN